MAVERLRVAWAAATIAHQLHAWARGSSQQHLTGNPDTRFHTGRTGRHGTFVPTLLTYSCLFPATAQAIRSTP
jgi:hypothetical protein